MKDLIYAYKEATGKNIRDTSIYSMIDRWPELITQVHRGRNKCFELSIPQEEALNIHSDFFKVKAKEPKFHTQIRDMILELLRQQQENCIKQSILIQKVAHLIPSGRHRNVIYKILGKMDEIEVYTVENKKFVRLK